MGGGAIGWTVYSASAESRVSAVVFSVALTDRWLGRMSLYIAFRNDDVDDLAVFTDVRNIEHSAQHEIFNLLFAHIQAFCGICGRETS